MGSYRSFLNIKVTGTTKLCFLKKFLEAYKLLKLKFKKQNYIYPSPDLGCLGKEEVRL